MVFGQCLTNESIFIVICTFDTNMYCRCRNLNCRTVGYKYKERILVASKYCQTVNCQTIEVSDCEFDSTRIDNSRQDRFSSGRAYP